MVYLVFGLACLVIRMMYLDFGFVNTKKSNTNLMIFNQASKMFVSGVSDKFDQSLSSTLVFTSFTFKCFPLQRKGFCIKIFCDPQLPIHLTPNFLLH